MDSSDQPIPVLIAGGGPVGLLLAHELQSRGVRALLVERNPETTRHPKMDITNGRSMEHFRRLGLIDAIRDQAVPPDHPIRVIWVTQPNGWELARFEYPCVDDERERIRSTNDGTLPLEPVMRISQVLIEPLLKKSLEQRAGSVEVRFGVGLESFEQDADGVTAVLRDSATGESETVRALYLAGCDGAGSVTRAGLGIELEYGLRPEDDVPAPPAPPGGDGRPPRLYLVHFHSKDLEFFERFGTVWHIQVPGGATIISQNDRDTWTMHAPLGDRDPESIDPKEFLFEHLGREIDCEIVVHNAWRPTLAMAPSYGSGRVWLAGDSVHQVIPTGGYGMNTGVSDAVALGWSLAAVLAGWGDESLLTAYDLERRPIGYRNRAASARHAGIRGMIAMLASPEIHEDSAAGEASRQELGAKILELGNLENEALGIELGYRYDDSPIVCHEEGAAAPPYEMERYEPGTWPGMRAPSVFLEDGRALFDLLGPWFTLLRFDEVDTVAFEAAAAERGVPVHVVDVRDVTAAQLYERRLVLLRPDQHVAWRGDSPPTHPGTVWDRVRGAAS